MSDNILSTAVEELLGRASGPMHFRLIMQPLMATFLAFKAAKRDAAEGRPAFLLEFVRNPADRGRLARSAWGDLSKIFIIALVLDTIYQFIALHQFRIVQTLLVAITLAIVPYVLFRGPFTRLLRRGAAKDAA